MFFFLEIQPDFIIRNLIQNFCREKNCLFNDGRKNVMQFILLITKYDLQKLLQENTLIDNLANLFYSLCFLLPIAESVYKNQTLLMINSYFFLFID